MKWFKYCILIVFLCNIGYADMIDDVIPAIISVESSGDPNAVSKAGAVGLMQITPIVLQEYNQVNFPLNDTTQGLTNYEIRMLRARFHYEDLFEIKINKEIGEWYLRRLRDYYLKNVSRSISPNMEQMFIFDGGLTPSVNIKNEWGVKTQEEFDLILILSAYNGGITRLRNNNYDVNKMPRETRNYIKKVMKLYKKEER